MKNTDKKRFIWKRGVLFFGVPTSIITCILTELLNSGTIVFNDHFVFKLIFYLVFMGLGAGLSWGYAMLWFSEKRK